MALYAFDGTWNDSSAPDAERDTKKDTNVHRFRILYGETVSYESGVGTRYGLLGKLIGGATGAGAAKRIDEQFDALAQNFKKGDTTIDVIGYSRGAAIARMFVHRIGRDFDRLQDGGGRLKCAPPVRFLGLFDTVASFGIPWTDDEHDFSTDIPEIVENTFHAMALDETRENFGIERCVGNRNRITEVWFRGGHGDIGGNATYVGNAGEQSNRDRSDIALNWMLAKARACNLPVDAAAASGAARGGKAVDAPVTAADEPISIGKAGTLSRRIHVGDLVHHTVEQTDLTRGIDGRLLRRIEVLTRIEDTGLESRADAMNWIPPVGVASLPDNVWAKDAPPSVVRLSIRRYPFDILPARTWAAWLSLWRLEGSLIAEGRSDEFWAASPADRGLAFDLLVEMHTRIAIQALGDDEGDDKAALDSIYSLFGHARSFMHHHGVECANAGALITAFLNTHVRPFTARWHKVSLQEGWKDTSEGSNATFRQELKDLQQWVALLANALSDLADAKL